MSYPFDPAMFDMIDTSSVPSVANAEEQRIYDQSAALVEEAGQKELEKEQERSAREAAEFNEGLLNGTVRPLLSGRGRIIGEAPKPISFSASVVSFVMLLLALSSAPISAYHTITFLHYDLGRPMWIAIVLGIVLILFSSTAFTVSRYFFTERKRGKTLGSLFLFLGLLIMCFSMFSTMGVSYRGFSWGRYEEQVNILGAGVQAQQSDMQVSLLREQEAWLLYELGNIDTRRPSLEVARDNRVGAWWATSQDAIRQLREDSEARARLSNELLTVRQQMFTSATDGYAAEAVIITERDDIFSFTARVFRFSEEALLFFMFSLPAVFLDVLAPLGLSVFLLLGFNLRRVKSVKVGANSSAECAGESVP
jgi:hypothetical protein